MLEGGAHGDPADGCADPHPVLVQLRDPREAHGGGQKVQLSLHLHLHPYSYQQAMSPWSVGLGLVGAVVRKGINSDERCIASTKIVMKSPKFLKIRGLYLSLIHI